MSPPRATPTQIAALARCEAVLVNADPPRASRIAFWQPDGTLPQGVASLGKEEWLTVIVRDERAELVHRRVESLHMPVESAVPVLTRARAAQSGTAAGYWGSAALLALQLAARGALLPSIDDEDHDIWRFGPLTEQDRGRLEELARAMPPQARANPLSTEHHDAAAAPLAEPRALLSHFLGAVADGLPRTAAAPLATGSVSFAAAPPRRGPELRPWVDAVAAGQDSAVRLSLRVEAHDLDVPPGGRDDKAAADPSEPTGGRRPTGRLFAVLQAHSVSDPSVVVDARELWVAGGVAASRFGPRAQREVLLGLRRAAAAWEPLSSLLGGAVPDAVELTDDDVASLLSPPTHEALTATGVQVHWPRELVRRLTTQAVVGHSPAVEDSHREQPVSALASLLQPEAVLRFDWRFAVGDLELTRSELDRLAEADRPLIRLRDQWVLLDPAEVRRAAARTPGTVKPVEALRGALTGSLETDGEVVEVRPEGRLEQLRQQLARSPEAAPPVAPPAALHASLRGYQLRGLNWLHQLTSCGLGGCLADDMGLGKTLTLIAFHLHRQSLGGQTAGPTLVVCPASLLGNWQREIERFAPGTPVRRYHGPRRRLSELAENEFVLTTYGTMRLDADKLAEAADWGLITADEAQHVKNPFSATAKALGTLPARARVALTGTPVENNLTELWSILNWATPGLLGTLPSFRRRYADVVEAGTELPEGRRAAERLSRLVSPFLLRRRKTDPGIAPELPPKTETDHAVALSREQTALYEATVREGLAELAGTTGLARRGLVIKLLTSLKQICNHPAQFLKEEDPVLVGRSGKWELFDELLDTLLAEDSSVLVFTQYVRLARLLERHLDQRGVGSLLLHGGTPVRRREQLVHDFQQGAAPVFLLSLKAAGTGLNLTRAEHVIHFDRWWNPAVESQATDRAHRIGQLRPVQVHRLITEGTVEDRIAQLLTRKAALADAVLEPNEAALTELSDRELAELVGLREVGR